MNKKYSKITISDAWSKISCLVSKRWRKTSYLKGKKWRKVTQSPKNMLISKIKDYMPLFFLFKELFTFSIQKNLFFFFVPQMIPTLYKVRFFHFLKVFFLWNPVTQLLLRNIICFLMILSFSWFLFIWEKESIHHGGNTHTHTLKKRRGM